MFPFPDQAVRRCPQRAFTVLELLVVIAIIGMLVGLLLPAIMHARESARRTQCVNNLHQIGLAIQTYHDANKKLPPAWIPAPDGVSGYGWATELLPHLEEDAIRRNIAEKLPVTASQNDAARTTDIAVMRCPSDVSEHLFDLYAEPNLPEEDESIGSKTFTGTPGSSPIASLPTANYVGVYGTLEADETFPAPRGDGSIISDRAVRFHDLERGTSKTIIVGERTTAMVPTTWFGVNFQGEDAACRLVGSAMTSPNCDFCDECEFASRHAGGANFVWADGHVSLIPADINSDEYQNLAKRRMY